MDKRPAIPAEIRRAILIEAGHRCAVKRCNETQSLEIHHIVPWNKCKKHEYKNLIALCPTCHRRADKGDMDRKSILAYKKQLIQEMPKENSMRQYDGEIVEIKRRILKSAKGKIGIPGFKFQFEFPEFSDKMSQIVTRNIELWLYELLIEFEQRHENYTPDPNEDWIPYDDFLNGGYEIMRMDSAVISIEYSIFRHVYGAAHGGVTTKVKNFLIKPFKPILLADLLNDDSNSLILLSSIIRKKILLSDKKFNKDDVIRGTEPKESHFKLFSFTNDGIIFIFVEYQIGCYSIGQTESFVSYEEIENIIKPEIYKTLTDENLMYKKYI